MPADARCLLEVLALAGQPVPRALVREVSRTADEPTAFSALRAAGLVRVTSGDALVEPYHDRIREAVVASTEISVARDIHGRLARVLEDRGEAEPERIAHHHGAAGDRARAGLWTERAADRALDALAFDRAADLYARALDLAEDADAPTRAAHWSSSARARSTSCAPG
jgi:hypothetical protein